MAVKRKRTTTTRKTRRRGAKRSRTAPSIERELSLFARRVKMKERTISRIRGATQRRLSAQRSSEEAMRRLVAERDTLRDTLEVLNGKRKAAEEERLAAARDLKEAEKAWAALQKRAKKQAAFRAIKDTVASIDTRIDKLRKKAGALEKQVAAAESDASAARAELAAIEKERREAQDALEKRPNEIRAARGQVSKLLAGLQSADPDDAQHVAAAERDFRDALDTLRGHARDASHADLVRKLLDTSAVDGARARMEAELQRLASAKTARAETQAALHELLQRRDNDIRTKILKRKPVNT